jgi:hypothetical protein
MLDIYVGVTLSLLTIGALNAIQTLLSRKKRQEKIDSLLAQMQDSFKFNKDEDES